MCWCPQLHHVQTWLSQPLLVLTVPNTGRNLPNSSYRGLDEEDHCLYKSLFAVLSSRYVCLLIRRLCLLTIIAPIFYMTSWSVVWDTMNELHRRNTLYNRWGYTMQIEPLHAYFPCPHCWAAYLVKIDLRVTSNGHLPLGAHVQSTCTRVVDIQIGKKDYHTCVIRDDSNLTPLILLDEDVISFFMARWEPCTLQTYPSLSLLEHNISDHTLSTVWVLIGCLTSDLPFSHRSFHEHAIFCHIVRYAFSCHA